MKTLASTQVNPQAIFRKERHAHQGYQESVGSNVVWISLGEPGNKTDLSLRLQEDNPHFVLGYN